MSKQLLAATAVLLIIVGGIWLLLSRAAKPIAAPAIVDLVLLDSDGKPKPISGEPSLTPSEALNFNVQLNEPCWVYVFRAMKGKTELEWGPQPQSPKLEPGVWAPEWQDVQGLHFPSGDATLYVVAAPERLEDAQSWTTADLETPRLRCPRCAISSLEVRVARPN